MKLFKNGYILIYYHAENPRSHFYRYTQKTCFCKNKTTYINLQKNDIKKAILTFKIEKNNTYIMSVVKFRLTEKTSKRPIQFVWIYLQSGTQPYQETTDSNGWAKFPNLPDGDYIVKVRSPDHRPYTKKSFISRNSIIEISLEKAYI